MHILNPCAESERDELADPPIRMVPARRLSHGNKERVALFFDTLPPRPRRHEYFEVHRRMIANNNARRRAARVVLFDLVRSCLR